MGRLTYPNLLEPGHIDMTVGLRYDLTITQEE
jgi:hypothetical protein